MSEEDKNKNFEQENIDEEQNKEKKHITLDELNEKVEDTVEEIYMGVDEAFYGDTHDYTHDIPAMMEMPDKPRKINKVQTRRNIINRVLGKKGKLIFLAVIGIAMIIGLVVSFVG